MGSPRAFLIACLLVVIWAVSGPLAGWSQTWQLVANTGTTIITFLMMFLVQSTTVRESRALHLKIDELVRVTPARNIFAHLEDADDEQMAKFDAEFRRFRDEWARRRRTDDDPTVPGRTMP
jgi:low affinity Fe/Cu permease